MTWTLRLFDADGVEVGWVTADPYEWKITHPTPDEYDRLRPSLSGWEKPTDCTQKVTFEGDEKWLVLEPFPSNINPDPKEHLEMIQDVYDGSYVASTALTDE